MFDAILQNMNESLAPQPAPFAPSIVSAPSTQAAATPLGGIIAVVRSRSDSAAPAIAPRANPISDARFGPLVIAANTLDGSDTSYAANSPEQPTSPSAPFFPVRPAGADALRTADSTVVPTAADVLSEPIAVPTQQQGAPPQDREQPADPMNRTPRIATGATVPQEPDVDPAAPQPVTNDVAPQNPIAVPASQADSEPVTDAQPETTKPAKTNIAQLDPAEIAIPASLSPAEDPRVKDAQPVARQPAKTKVAQLDPAEIAIPASSSPVEDSLVKDAQPETPQVIVPSPLDPAEITTPVSSEPVDTAQPVAPQPAKTKFAQQDPAEIATPVRSEPVDTAQPVAPQPAKAKFAQQDPAEIATPNNPMPVETAPVKDAKPATPQPTKSNVAQLDPAAAPTNPTPAEPAPKPTKGKPSEQDTQDVALPVAPAPQQPAEQPAQQPSFVPQQPVVQPVIQPVIQPTTAPVNTPVTEPTVNPPARPATDQAAAFHPVVNDAATPTVPSPALQTAVNNIVDQAPQSPLPQTTATDETQPEADKESGNKTSSAQQQQIASAEPVPPVFIAPLAAPAQAAPAEKRAGDAAPALTAPKSVRPDAGTADQTAPAALFTSHVPSAPHPAEPKAEIAAAPAPASQPGAAPVADATNNVAQNATTAPSAPQADNPSPAPQHQPSATPVMPVNPALQQAPPTGLRKLTAGLQVSAQEQETTSTLDKIGVSIVTRATDGLRHFDIRLDPPELGRVEVRLSVDDSGKAQASLIVDKPQTLEMLQRDSSSLNRALTDAGLDLSNNGLNFSLRDQNRQNDGDVDQGRGRALSAKAVVQTDASPIHSSLGSYAPNSVRLDIRV